RQSGPLMFGHAVAGPLRIGCNGLVDEIRISRTVRTIQGVPQVPFPKDGQTLGIWHFEDQGDFAQAGAAPPTPAAAVATPPHQTPTRFGADPSIQNDADWVDDRFSKMDTGPFMTSTIQTPGRPTYKGIAIKLGEDGRAAV